MFNINMQPRDEDVTTRSDLYPPNRSGGLFLTLTIASPEGRVHLFVTDPAVLDRVAAEATIAACKLRDAVKPPPAPPTAEEIEAAEAAERRLADALHIEPHGGQYFIVNGTGIRIRRFELESEAEACIRRLRPTQAEARAPLSPF